MRRDKRDSMIKREKARGQKETEKKNLTINISDERRPLER